MVRKQPQAESTPPGRYPYGELHRALLALSLPEGGAQDERSGAQARFCPHYVRLEGRAGGDWGVVLNPVSRRFGVLTYEGDDCGCPPRDGEELDGLDRHDGEQTPPHLL